MCRHDQVSPDDFNILHISQVFGEIGIPPESTVDGPRPPRKLWVGTTAVGFRRDDMEVRWQAVIALTSTSSLTPHPSPPASFQLKSVMSQGVIHDWEALEAILDHALK